MHELFMIVLSKRDLSRAGDLFSVPDAEIVNDITEVLSDINPIISHSDYLKNNNDQSVVEICVTRVLSCIRETKTAERCCSVLVDLLKSCLLSNLQPVGSSKEDPPHAKIAADIISSIFLNYDKRELMRIALPVAVQFLPKGNKELSRNLASYLSLAAIDYAYLLCPHVKYIIDSIQAGNYGLIRVLTQIYDVSPEVVTPYAAHWIDLLPLCDAQEKLTVFQLYLLIAKKNPQVLECYVPQLCELLADPDTAIINMKILLKIAEKRPHFFINYLDKIKISTKSINNSVSLGARILAAAGRASIETAQYALDFVLEHLPHSDRASQAILLHEATRLCSEYPILFTDKVLACVRQKNALSQQKPSASEISTTAFGGNKISGGVTIVNVNSNTVASIPVTSCSEDLQSTTTSISRASTISAYKINSIISCDSAVSATTGCVTPVSTATATIGRLPKNDHKEKNTSSPKEITYRDIITTTTNNKNISIPFTTNSKNQNNASTLNTLLNNKNAASSSMNHNNNKKQHYGALTATTNNSNTSNSTTTTIATHAGYTRRVKLGDSRSTGRLHPSSNTHRSMTRLNVAGGSVVGLHKSMTRLSSSQHINQNSSNSNNNQRNLNNRSKNQTNHNNNNTPNSTHSNSSGNVIIQTASTPKAPTTANSLAYVTPVPPLSNNVIITGHNKWGIPSTQVTSGGVTVTTSPIKVRPHSQGLTVQLNSNTTLNQYTGSLRNSQNAISVHHASPAAPQQTLQNDNDRSVMKLPVNENNVKVIVSGPTTNVTQRCSQDNTSRTLLNANNSLLDILDQRMSTFEPYQIMRDPVQQFCEKHYNSIKSYMDEVSQFLPPPTRCSIEVSNEFAERRTKKVAKLHFACQIRGPHCLYSKSCFTMPIRNPKTWIHLMFLDFQVRHYVKEKCVLSTREPGISNLKNIWQILKCENRSFTELVTSQFPNSKDRNMLINELRHSGFLDVFAVSKTVDSSHSSCNELEYQWGCFLCNHPDKAVGFLNGSNQPVIEGQLKEKKGKWRLFRRWRTRYFTLSGAHLSCKGSSGGESIDVNQIRSVKVSRGARNIPKAFEIFTADQTLILKPKNGKNAEEWVQCLSIVVAHSQSRENPIGKTNSLPARGIANNKP